MQKPALTHTFREETVQRMTRNRVVHGAAVKAMLRIAKSAGTRTAR